MGYTLSTHELDALRRLARVLSLSDDDPDGQAVLSTAAARIERLAERTGELEARIRRHRDAKLAGVYMASERRAYEAGERDEDDEDHALWAALDEDEMGAGGEQVRDRT